MMFRTAVTTYWYIL